MHVEWAVYKRTGGGFIATPDSPKKLKRYCWITAEGMGYYKEFGQPQIILGLFKPDDIAAVVEAVKKLG